MTERFLHGFGEVREVQATITQTYENEVLKPAKEMAGLYAIIEGAIGTRDALLLPSLGKSREAFTASLVAANAFYLSLASDAADEARRNIATIEQTIPVMIDLAENNLQRAALAALAQRAAAFREGLKSLAEQFATRTNLLKTAIDDNQAAMIAGINQLSDADDAARAAGAGKLRPHARRHLSERRAGRRHLPDRHRRDRRADRAQHQPAAQGDHGGDACRRVAEKYDQPIHGTQARDEIGEMARAVEVFRENAHRQAQGRERAAGVQGARRERARGPARGAAEPDRGREARGARRSGRRRGARGEQSDRHQPHGGIELRAPLRRFRQGGRATARCGARALDEFLDGSRDAANQLVANLQRAGELVQSFKQVAVDRSHAERRQFDLRESTDQIIASLRPVLKKSQITLTVDVPSGIMMDSYPGSYGQVLTNLFLNSVVHAFPDGRAGQRDHRGAAGRRR